MDRIPIHIVKEIDELIPNDQTYIKTKLSILSEQLSSCQAQYDEEQKQPPWLLLFNESIQYLGLCILAAGYIFRTGRTGGNTVMSKSLEYASARHKQILRIVRGEENYSPRHSNKSYNTAGTAPDIDRPVKVFNDNER